MYVKIPQNIKKKDITLDLKTGTMSLKVGVFFLLPVFFSAFCCILAYVGEWCQTR